MGKIVNERCPIENENFIDYPFLEEKTDFLDIWLVSKCFFCVTTATGLDNVGVVFDKPLLYVNHLPYGDCRTGSFKTIELFKKLFDTKKKKYVSLREQISNKLIHSFNTNDYLNKNIKIVDNTPEEIIESVMQIEELALNNNYKIKDTNKFEQKFWAIFKEWEGFNKYHGRINPKISSKFLKENYKWLLN